MAYLKIALDTSRANTRKRDMIRVTAESDNETITMLLRHFALILPGMLSEDRVQAGMEALE